MKEITHLNWDSDFFKLKIGRININELGKDNLLFINQDQYDLIYLFSDNEIQQKEKCLKDIKTVLKCSVIESSQKKVHEVVNIREFDLKIDSYSDLLNLVLQSGVYSRFKLDSNFKEESYRMLYKKWLDKSLSYELADYVRILVFKDEIAGFITLKKEKGYLNIVLIAVDVKFRGLGFGTSLLDEAKRIANNEGFSHVNVTTQLFNTPAMKLYTKNGFEIINKTYIYHIWNENTIQ